LRIATMSFSAILLVICLSPGLDFAYPSRRIFPVTIFRLPRNSIATTDARLERGRKVATYLQLWFLRGAAAMTITTLSSREFNQNTSHAKKAALKGPVFITDRGKPVARIEPIDRQDAPGPIRDLVESGRMVFKTPLRKLPTPITMTPGDKTSTDYVREQRR
jgi:antitoxin (DNA-binding transcriptional repressor) of toxin-antitoxin stability system